MNMNVATVNKDGTATAAIENPSVASTAVKEPQTENSGGKPEQKRELGSDAAKALVEEIQQHLNAMNVSLSFSTYGENSRKISVTVTDKETGKVIREIPPKELQNLSMKIDELAGLIFNEVA